MEVRKGQIVSIQLIGNPSAGYKWQLISYDEDKLELLSQETREIRFAPRAVGV